MAEDISISMRRFFVYFSLCIATSVAIKSASAQSAVDKAQILKTNEAFYTSFRTGNLRGMKNVWSSTQKVGMIPPGRDFLAGIDKVLAAFGLMMIRPPDIECQLEGTIEFRDGKAILVCDERLRGNESVRMLNVFAPEEIDGETVWKMIYHGPIAEDKRRT